MLLDINGRQMLVLKDSVPDFSFWICLWHFKRLCMCSHIRFVYFLFITRDFLILVPDLRNYILDTRIYMAHSLVQCSVLHFENQRRKLQTILDTFF